MKYQAVLFDLDGTLLDTLGDIGGTLNHVLQENGYSPAPWRSTAPSWATGPGC